MSGVTHVEKFISVYNGMVNIDCVHVKILYQQKHLVGKFGGWCDALLVAVKPVMEKLRDDYKESRLELNFQITYAGRVYRCKERYY